MIKFTAIVISMFYSFFCFSISANELDSFIRTYAKNEIYNMETLNTQTIMVDYFYFMKFKKDFYNKACNLTDSEWPQCDRDWRLYMLHCVSNTPHIKNQKMLEIEKKYPWVTFPETLDLKDSYMQSLKEVVYDEIRDYCIPCLIYEINEEDQPQLLIEYK